MTVTSAPLLYTPSRVFSLYNSPRLADAVMALERISLIADATNELSKSVNTSISQTAPVSRWVRYREGYSPAIVEFLLRRFPMKSSDGYIFDPMCGSGSTQVAAQRLGYYSAGTDVNPYAVLVSNVKTRPLRRTQRKVLEEAMRGSAFRGSSHRGKLADSDAYLARYFTDENLRQLIHLRRWIADAFENEPVIRDFARVGLLSIVEACSNRRKDGNGLATRPSKISDPSSALIAQLSLMLEDLANLGDEQPPSATYLISALDIDSTVSLVDRAFKRELGAVIFSPPYANSFDYFESYKLELLFGDFYDRDQLQAARSNLIRNYRQSGLNTAKSDNELVESLIDEILARIPLKERRSGVVDGRSRLLPNLLRGYFQDMGRFLQRAARVMPSGSMMHLVVDQSAYLGVPIPTDLLLADLAEKEGLELESILICRPAKTSAQQVLIQPMLKETLRESVISLRK